MISYKTKCAHRRTFWCVF